MIYGAWLISRKFSFAMSILVTLKIRRRRNRHGLRLLLSQIEQWEIPSLIHLYLIVTNQLLQLSFVFFFDTNLEVISLFLFT